MTNADLPGACSVEPGRAPSLPRGSGGAEAAAAGPGVLRVNCQSGEPAPVVLVIVSPGSEPVSPLPKGWFGIRCEVWGEGRGKGGVTFAEVQFWLEISVTKVLFCSLFLSHSTCTLRIFQLQL